LEVTSETKPETPLESLTDHELLLRLVRVTEHLDPMIHEVHQWAKQAAPLLERFGGFKAAIGKVGRHGR
jgi:hypothetical protein